MTHAPNPCSRAIDHVVWAVSDLENAYVGSTGFGFNVTPEAQHPAGMGTSNRLIQFENRSFIEFLQVDRPTGIKAHEPERLFSFGAHNRDYLKSAPGISMLVFQTDDALADTKEFAADGLALFERFDFGRKATRPNGEIRDVAFRLAFAIEPGLSSLACFTCENVYPENFWNPQFQAHDNQAKGIKRIEIEALEPEIVALYLAKVARSQASKIGEAWRIECGNGQSLVLKALDPDRSIGGLDVFVTALVLRGDENYGLTNKSLGEVEIVFEAEAAETEAAHEPS